MCGHTNANSSPTWDEQKNLEKIGKGVIEGRTGQNSKGLTESESKQKVFSKRHHRTEAFQVRLQETESEGERERVWDEGERAGEETSVQDHLPPWISTDIS